MKLRKYLFIIFYLIFIHQKLNNALVNNNIMKFLKFILN